VSLICDCGAVRFDPRWAKLTRWVEGENCIIRCNVSGILSKQSAVSLADLRLAVKGVLGVSIAGSLALFAGGVAMFATQVSSMSRFALLVLRVFIIRSLLGSTTPFIAALAWTCLAGLRCNSGPRTPLLRGSFDAFPADARPDPGVTVMAAPSAQDVAIGLPLMVSLITILVTIVIHALALLGIFHFVRRQHLLRRTGVRFWRDVAIYVSILCKS
jgi:hypothetical protein